MRQFMCQLFLCFCLTGIVNAQVQSDPAQLISQLQELVDQKDYFALKDAYDSQRTQLPKVYAMYFDAILQTVFNHPAKSNELIADILKAEPQRLSPDWLKRLYSIKLQNHIDLFEYAQAERVNRFIVATYGDLLDSTEVDEYRNSRKIWEALEDAPKQEIVRNGDFHGRLNRDKMGLLRINSVFGTDSLSLIFDTGANFSVMQRSVAGRLGLKLLNVEFEVTAATGQKVKSDLAIAPEILFGDIRLKNVVFLVFNDEDLSFPQVDYQIEGIIGFPVIKAMEEIQIDKENNLYVPKSPRQYTDSNFALDGLMPIVAVNYAGERLCFHFDTGATHTSLFPAFYQKYQEKIDRKYKLENFKAGSAGGEITQEGYILKKLPLDVAGAKASLKKIRLNLNETGLGDNYYGNLGQDYIRQFNAFAISFKYASIRFW